MYALAHLHFMIGNRDFLGIPRMELICKGWLISFKRCISSGDSGKIDVDSIKALARARSGIKT
jgi:hypothetical protein